MMYRFKTRGTCSTQIQYDVVDGVLRNVSFSNGCRGNLQGVSRLVDGMTPRQVIDTLKGIRCQGETSCPDQLARAMEEYLQKSAK